MKNLYLLLLFPAFFAKGQNQTWQVDFNANVTTLSPLPNGHWLVGGAVGGANWLFSNGYLAETNLEGTYFLSKEADIVDRTIVQAALPLPDGRQVVSGLSEACDVGLGGFIRLYNAAGTPVWTRATNLQAPNEFFPGISALLLTAQQELIAVGGNTILRLDLETGLTIQEKLMVGVSFYDITSSNGAYLVATGNKIFSMDDSLNLTQIAAPLSAGTHYQRIVAGPNNGFFALQNDNKVQYRRWNGTDFEWRVLTTGLQVNDIVATDHGAMLCGMAGGLGQVMFITDSTQVETTGFALPAPDLIPQRVRIAPGTGEIVVAGLELHGPFPRIWESPTDNSSGSQHFWIQSFQPDGSTQNSGVDAALVEMITNKLPKAEPYTGAPWTLYNWRIYSDGNFSVRLKNTGSEPLHSVHILAGRYSVDDPGFCPALNYINKRFSQLDLAPGADTTLLIGDLGYGYAEKVNPWQLCFWVTAPNDKVDANHDNDFVCGEFNLISAAHEPEITDLTLYPNPAQDAIYISGTPGWCRIFNAAGQFVSEQIPMADQRIDVSRLPAGLYLLQTEIGRGRFVKN